MLIWGLHILDVAIIIFYILIILWLGKRAGQKTKNTGDFFLAGRKLGKFYQFFLNFGCSTNADQTVAVSREIYRQGIGGMWIQYLVLFLTTFYWFTALFFRRVRLTTIGDFFTERFKSRFLGGSYTVFILLMSILGVGIGYMIAAKTMMAMTPKSVGEYSYEERLSIEQFQEYQELRPRVDVEIGKAEYVGQSIEKQHIIEPTCVFFENVARIDPADPSSPKVGLGRFHAEIWVLSWFGLEDSYNNPGKFEKDKILPGSNWEILKPSKTDFLGFGGSWIAVGVIILLLWLMVSIK